MTEAEARAALEQAIASQPERRPQLGRVVVDGETLWFVIGNPSATCGVEGDQVWFDFVQAALKIKEQTSALALALALDVLLAPTSDKVTEWIERWPILTRRFGSFLQQKIGMGEGVLRAPARSDVMKVEIAHALRTTRYGKWFHLVRGNKRTEAMVVATPSSAQWDGFIAGLRGDGDKAWSTCVEMAQACCPLVLQDGTPISIASVIAEHPGVALQVVVQAGSQAGADAEIFLEG